MNIKIKLFVGTILLVAVIFGCGEVPVTIDEDTYAPKIVVDGTIMPGNKVENIRITRNFPLNTEIDLNEVFISDAIVTLTDISAEETYPLEFNPLNFGYGYSGDDLVIEDGQSYTLSVQATVAGKQLSANSTTTVPRNGFAIRADESLLSPLKYRERDENGDLRLFTIEFDRSATTDSYIASIVSLDASKETFVTDNPFDIEIEDLDEDNLFALLQHQSQWLQTQSGGGGTSKMELLWFTLWFYGKYRVILYATDDNLKDYFLTHKQIQDIDGNLWEPKFHFNGEGIGVFGSAIADTVFIEVLPD